MLRKLQFSFSAQTKANFYELLELQSNCTQRQVKYNYLRLAKVYHPDVYKGTDKMRFQKIQEAYQTLKSVERRRTYDLSMKIKTDVNSSNPYYQDKNNKYDNESNKEEDLKNQKDQEDFVKAPNQFHFRDYEKKTIHPDEVVEEYNQFMEKPMKTDPGELKAYENIMMRQMSPEYKQQLKYMQKKNNPYLVKFLQNDKPGYHWQVKQYISSMNDFFKTKQEEDPVLQQKAYERRLRAKIIIVLIVLGGLFFPMVYSGFERRRKIQQWIKEDKEKLEELENNAKQMETQFRFRY